MLAGKRKTFTPLKKLTNVNETYLATAFAQGGPSELTPPPARRMPRRVLGYEAPSPAAKRRSTVTEAAAPPNAGISTAACLPAPADNAAIAVDALSAGQRVKAIGGGTDEEFAPVTLLNDLLEGHRFAVRTIPAGELLLSWGEPFGKALRPIAAGEWLVNRKSLELLHARGVAASVSHPNFENYVKPVTLSRATFEPGKRMPYEFAGSTFDGFVRGAQRGVGTRNYLVLLPLSSRANAFARALERRLGDQLVRLRAQAPRATEAARVGAAAEEEDGAGDGADGAGAVGCDGHDGLDGIVALPHSEDGAATRLHGALGSEGGGDGASPAAANHAHLLRTLLGLSVHPNVGAALLLQTEEDVAAAATGGGVSYPMLQETAKAQGHGARLEATRHAVLTLRLHDFIEELEVQQPPLTIQPTPHNPAHPPYDPAHASRSLRMDAPCIPAYIPDSLPSTGPTARRSPPLRHPLGRAP